MTETRFGRLFNSCSSREKRPSPVDFSSAGCHVSSPRDTVLKQNARTKSPSLKEFFGKSKGGITRGGSLATLRRIGLRKLNNSTQSSDLIVPAGRLVDHVQGTVVVPVLDPLDSLRASPTGATVELRPFRHHSGFADGRNGHLY